MDPLLILTDGLLSRRGPLSILSRGYLTIAAFLTGYRESFKYAAYVARSITHRLNR